ncbi:putative membrane protein (plasmid) [Yersinia pestis biovar Microtus str. 91001]|uniref:Membrane protein n=1 Tax=Yersinia pestis TaxID=632 RepID=A0A0H2W1C9_YERPE|nr:putative membrane protein [Yersinia pestis biovar Microtus str. 91001]
MQRDIHRPASTRYAVLYGLPVSLSTSANRFLARSISFAGVFCDFLMKTRSMMMVLPLWYTHIPLAMSVPIVRISKSPSPRGFVSGSRSNRASYSSLPMRRSNFTLIFTGNAVASSLASG